MKAKEPRTGYRRGRGMYTQACDVCARKKTKCDGTKPVCQQCKHQGGEEKCTWTRNPSRKHHFDSEALRKRTENLIICVEEYHRYADYLESLLDQCYQNYDHHQTVDFRASRPRPPAEIDGLVGGSVEALDNDFDFMAMSVDGDDEIGLVHDGSIAPFTYNHLELFNHPRTSRFFTIADNTNATYVLLVEGVDEQNCPDLDWARNLPTSVPLDRKSHDRALDLLFKFYTSWCLRIVPDLFLRDMYEALSVPPSQPAPETSHYSPMLHNALVALALALLDDHQFKDLETRKCYSNKAKSLIEAECQKPNLSVVNALSILASFHGSQGEQPLGYLYFGMSVRMSQALGLSLDCSEWVKLGAMDEPDKLDRHCANWSTFAQDVCWSLFVGQDFCVTSPSGTKLGQDVVLPPVDQQYDQIPWVHTPLRFHPKQPNYLTSTFSATCELLLISRRIMDVVNGRNTAGRPPFALNDLISEIDGTLNSWKGALPLELELTITSRRTATPHKLMLHLTYWWLFILLHRPFFHQKARTIDTDKDIDHVKLCRRAAESIMEILATWRSLYSLRYCPIVLIQIVFSAGTVHLLTAIQAVTGIHIAQKPLRHSMDQQQLVITYLHEIGRTWECATGITNILRGLMKEQLKPLLERRAAARRLPIHANPDDVQIPECITGQRKDDKENRPTAHSPSPSTSNRSESGRSDSSLRSWSYLNRRASRLQNSMHSSTSSDSPGTVYSVASSRTGSVDYGILYTRRAFSLEPSPQNQP